MGKQNYSVSTPAQLSFTTPAPLAGVDPTGASYASSVSKSGYGKDIVALKDKAGHLHALCDELARAGQRDIADRLKDALNQIWDNFDKIVGSDNSLSLQLQQAWQTISDLEGQINSCMAGAIDSSAAAVDLGSGKIIQIKTSDTNQLQLSLYTQISVSSNPSLSNIELAHESNNNLPASASAAFSKTLSSYTATVEYPTPTYYNSTYVTTSSSTLSQTNTKSDKTVTYTITSRSFSRPFNLKTVGTEVDAGPNGANSATSTGSVTYKAQVLGFTSSNTNPSTSASDYAFGGTKLIAGESGSTLVYVNNVFGSPSISSALFTINGKANDYLFFALPKSLVAAKGITAQNCGQKFILNECGLPGGVVTDSSWTFTKYDTKLIYQVFKVSNPQTAGKLLVRLV